MNPSPNYVAVTAAYNERETIDKVITSVLQQNPSPKVYVVVDDGSTDDTPEIIKNYPVEYLRIDDPKLFHGYQNRQRAFNVGAARATEIEPNWKFLLKVDADSIIPTDYFLKLNAYMERYSSIGTCSGVPQGENVWKGRSSNGAIIYRRECWDDIGGFHPIPAWDTHAILKSYFKGWCSIAFSHIRYNELRTSERTNLREWYYSGQARFLMGFPMYHSMGVFIIHVKKKPPFLGSLIMCLTHLIQIVGRRTKPFSKSYYDYVKKHAWWEIKVRMRGRFLV